MKAAALAALDDLEARVAKMRALGVTRWGDIELGQPPGPPPRPPSDEDIAAKHAREQQAREDQLFGASSIRPQPRRVG